MECWDTTKDEKSFRTELPEAISRVDGRNPANQLRLVVYPIIYKVSYMSGGCLGFLPSTVFISVKQGILVL